MLITMMHFRFRLRVGKVAFRTCPYKYVACNVTLSKFSRLRHHPKRPRFTANEPLGRVYALLSTFRRGSEVRTNANVHENCEKVWGSKPSRNLEESTFSGPVSDVSADDETSLAQIAITARDALDMDDLLI